MPQRPAKGRNHLPEPAALAALAISESMALALVESGVIAPPVLRRCLLDAVAAYSTDAADPHLQAVRVETTNLIDQLLRQIDAVAPATISTQELALAEDDL